MEFLIKLKRPFLIFEVQNAKLLYTIYGTLCNRFVINIFYEIMVKVSY